MNEYTAGNAVQKKYRKLDKLVKRGKEDLEKWKTCQNGKVYTVIAVFTLEVQDEQIVWTEKSSDGL